MRILALVIAVGSAYGQTQLDLGLQGKNIDFSGAPATRPVKTGTTLPASCGVGDLFFQSSATAGQNLYGCVAANTWVVQSNGAAGELTIQNNGTTVGAEAILDLVGGFGIQNTISSTGTKILLQQGIDTAVVPSKAAEQSGGLLLCASAGASSSAYSCGMAPTLSAYTSGMLLHWIPDTNGAGGATTVNVDTLGAKPVRLPDGVANPSATDIESGHMYALWYDGSVFRMLSSPEGAIRVGTQPACNASQRGKLWLTAGGMGVADTVAVCAKDASDAYNWSEIY